MIVFLCSFPLYRILFYYDCISLFISFISYFIMIVFLFSHPCYRILFHYCFHISCLLCSFYTAEIVCGLEFLHSLGIIYRYVLDSLGTE